MITEVPIIQKLGDWFAGQINKMVSIWYGHPSWKSYMPGIKKPRLLNFLIETLNLTVSWIASFGNLLGPPWNNWNKFTTKFVLDSYAKIAKLKYKLKTFFLIRIIIRKIILGRFSFKFQCGTISWLIFLR